MTQARNKRGAVLCVGRVYCDLIFSGAPRLPSMGTEVYAEGLELHAGGGAFITAAHLAALGRRSGLAACLPGAPFADAVRGDIRAAGIDTSLCALAPSGVDPQVTVVIAGQGDRAFLTRRTGPALPPLDIGDLIRSGAGHLHIGELATLAEHPGIVAAARTAGMTISLDCGWDETLDGSDLARLIAAVDIFLPNRSEAEHLSAAGLPERPAPLTVVKCGADGARALWADGSASAPAQAAVPVDTTGAGDAFNAGFLDAWLSGSPVPICLAAGNAAGARAIERCGGFSPLPEDAEAAV